ncbi:MAG TPA: glycoside hydrolase family 88 protein [Opitutaceae bacterium]|nr:glycoside hydrolase family 88 protein [Opitutaceae bacterium]
MSKFATSLLFLSGFSLAFAQSPTAPTDTPTPAAQPATSARTPTASAPKYPVPYAPASVQEIRAVMDRVLGYLETANAVKIVDAETEAPATDLSHLPEKPSFAKTDFRVVSYEWGVTYSGMLAAAAATGDKRYTHFVDERLTAIAAVAAKWKDQPLPERNFRDGGRSYQIRSVLKPSALDDCGAMGAAMIRASRAGIHSEQLRPWIDNYLDWISHGQYRFADGTLARNRPMKDALWLDDLYMSVPALSQMGVLTGDGKYFDDAARQIRQFAERMFVPEKGLWRHGWIQAMTPHPAFFWGRANGWAIIAMAELLDVLPENHPDREKILSLYRAQAAALAALQDKEGRWHQLLDHNDTYHETSASTMFVYAIAHGVNKGWLDPLAYVPMLSLGWNSVAQQVNAQGQVENTCIGTGMAFDPAFYAYRPVSVYAAHGYGPIFLAGAEMIQLRQGKAAKISVSDGGVHADPRHER